MIFSHLIRFAKKVKFPEDNPEYGLARTKSKVVFENDLDKLIVYSSAELHNRFMENLFE